MANRFGDMRHGSVAAWAKRCYFAGRALMEAALRPYGLGPTQWYVLYHLARDGATMQRELLRTLKVERATLSVIVGELVLKGLIEQVPDRVDGRQKLLRMTAPGEALWNELPDLETLIHKAAFDGIDDGDIAIAVRVLRAATERLDALSSERAVETDSRVRRDQPRGRAAAAALDEGGRALPRSGARRKRRSRRRNGRSRRP